LRSSRQKKVAVGPQNVLEQAKRYARGASNGPGNWNGLRVPFLYSSNGELVWYLDARDPKKISRQIANLHTADAFTEAFAKNRAKEDSSEVDSLLTKATLAKAFRGELVKASRNESNITKPVISEWFLSRT